MSGGAFDYAYSHVDYFVEEMQRRLAGCNDSGEEDEWRMEFVKSMSPTTLQLLKDTQLQAQIMAKKMKAVEWFFSGDIDSNEMKRQIVAAELINLDEGYIT